MQARRLATKPEALALVLHLNEKQACFKAGKEIDTRYFQEMLQ